MGSKIIICWWVSITYLLVWRYSVKFLAVLTVDQLRILDVYNIPISQYWRHKSSQIVHGHFHVEVKNLQESWESMCQFKRIIPEAREKGEGGGGEHAVAAWYVYWLDILPQSYCCFILLYVRVYCSVCIYYFSPKTSNFNVKSIHNIHKHILLQNKFLVWQLWILH